MRTYYMCTVCSLRIAGCMTSMGIKPFACIHCLNEDCPPRIGMKNFVVHMTKDFKNQMAMDVPCEHCSGGKNGT